MRSSENIWAATVLVCLLLLTGLFGFALFVPPAANSHGVPHADYPSLLQGGAGAERHGAILWLGWAIGAVEILLFGALVALGARRGSSLGSARDEGGLRGLLRPLAICLVAYLGVWTALMIAYARYLGDPSPELIFALPAPTAIMLYLVWPLPLVFAGLYTFGFRRWVFSERDEAAFRELVERRRVRNSDTDVRDDG